MARLDRLQYLIRLGYDGSRFFGVPNQPGNPTVSVALRARLEEAAGQRAGALNFTARTDRGVHAVENLATCWFLPPFDAEAFEAAVSLDRPDGLEGVVAEPTGFHTHARNVGRGKWYRYRLRIDGEQDPRAWILERPVDINAMVSMAHALVGTHDYTAYCFKPSSPNTVKNVSRVDVSADAGVITIDIEGDSFLRQMVRKMVSVIVAVGEGSFEQYHAEELLYQRVSRGTPPSAPPQGLTLMAIRRADD
jgi:tRNA pseudouridine38-40 synthase